MASYTAKLWKHAQLVAATADTVEFAQGPPSVTVVNRDGTDEIYFRVDGVAPTVGGDDCFVLPAAIGQLTVGGTRGVTPLDVKLISAGTPKYSVGTLS